MRGGSKKCLICKEMALEPKLLQVKYHRIALCHVCYVHLLSVLFNIEEKMIREYKGEKDNGKD